MDILKTLERHIMMQPKKIKNSSKSSPKLLISEQVTVSATSILNESETTSPITPKQ